MKPKEDTTKDSTPSDIEIKEKLDRLGELIKEVSPLLKDIHIETRPMGYSLYKRLDTGERINNMINFIKKEPFLVLAIIFLTLIILNQEGIIFLWKTI
jgi:hypothetical protein